MEVTTTTAKKKVAADRHPLAVAFGEYLKSVRKDSDKSQAELAFDASMDRTYVSLLERGCWRRPKTEPLLRVVPTQN